MGITFLSEQLFARLTEGRWLVGVSGGGDSVGMLRILVEQLGPERLVVGCFNHAWGPFGHESEGFVEDLAGRLGVAFVKGRGTGKAATNAEAVAREERYAWFESVCRERGLAGVLIAHTREDDVETFLMRAGKGSGLRGLSGMKAASLWGSMTVLRPLLGIGREELRNYLRGVGQAWMEDPDNSAGGSQRARLRKLLPALEDAGVGSEALAATLAALADAEELVAELVGEYPMDIVGDYVVWERDGFVSVPVELAVRVLERAMLALVGGMVVRRGKRVALWQRIRLEEQGAATLGGVKFEWANGYIRAEKEHKGDMNG